jgi:hydrogenase nickel incorporation protein HypB
MFRAADLLLLTKSDLLAVLDDFDPARAERHLRQLANAAPVLQLSARKGQGLDAWLAWLRDEIAARRAAARKLRPVSKPNPIFR